MEFVRRVYENGKLTIPKEIREVHGIREGDLVRLEVVEVLREGRTLEIPQRGAPDVGDEHARTQEVS